MHTCQQCRHWVYVQGDIGECHRSAPISVGLVANLQTLTATWPQTDREQGCGDFVALERPACYKCEHWHPEKSAVKNDPNVYIGQCRIDPPSFQKEAAMPRINDWPRTEPDAFCSKFSPKFRDNGPVPEPQI
jgi:hypothetical protein